MILGLASAEGTPQWRGEPGLPRSLWPRRSDDSTRLGRNGGGSRGSPGGRSILHLLHKTLEPQWRGEPGLPRRSPSVRVSSVMSVPQWRGEPGLPRSSIDPLSGSCRLTRRNGGGSRGSPGAFLALENLLCALLPQWRGEPGLPRSLIFPTPRSPPSLPAAMEGGAGAPPEPHHTPLFCSTCDCRNGGGSRGSPGAPRSPVTQFAPTSRNGGGSRGSPGAHRF